jgi:hypothetical protein
MEPPVNSGSIRLPGGWVQYEEQWPKELQKRQNVTEGADPFDPFYSSVCAHDSAHLNWPAVPRCDKKYFHQVIALDRASRLSNQ